MLQICIIISPGWSCTRNVLCTFSAQGETLSVAKNRPEYGMNLYYTESRGCETESAPSLHGGHGPGTHDWNALRVCSPDSGIWAQFAGLQRFIIYYKV